MKSINVSLFIFATLMLCGCDFLSTSDFGESNPVNESSGEVYEKYKVSEEEWIQSFSKENHSNVTVDIKTNIAKKSGYTTQKIDLDLKIKVNENKNSILQNALGSYEISKSEYLNEKYPDSSNIPSDELLIEEISTYYNQGKDNVSINGDVIKISNVSNIESFAYYEDYDSSLYDSYNFNNRYDSYTISRMLGRSLDSTFEIIELFTNNVYLNQYYDYAKYDESTLSYTIDGSKLPYYVNSYYSFNLDVLKINESIITYSFVDKNLSKITISPLIEDGNYLEVNYENRNNTLVDSKPNNIANCEHYYTDQIGIYDDNFHYSYCYYCGNYNYEYHSFSENECTTCGYQRKDFSNESLIFEGGKGGEVIVQTNTSNNKIEGVLLDSDYDEIISSGNTGNIIGYYFYGTDLYVEREIEYRENVSRVTYYFYSYSTKKELHDPIVIYVD